MRKLLIICISLCTFLFSCSDPKGGNGNDLILDAPLVINKNPEAVKKILGQPDSIYTKPIFNKRVLVYYYAEYEVECRFYNNRALEILVKGTRDIPYEESSLAMFGISPKAPTERNGNVLISWNNFDQFKTISFFTRYRNDDGTPSVYEIFFKGKPD